MTRLISVKTVSDLPEAFKDRVSFQVVDENLECIMITIGNTTIRVVSKDAYSNTLKVLAEEPDSYKEILKRTDAKSYIA